MVDGIGDYEQVKAMSLTINFEGKPLQILSLDGIIQSKSALKREKDRYALAILHRLKQIKEEQAK